MTFNCSEIPWRRRSAARVFCYTISKPYFLRTLAMLDSDVGLYTLAEHINYAFQSKVYINVPIEDPKVFSQNVSIGGITNLSMLCR